VPFPRLVVRIRCSPILSAEATLDIEEADGIEGDSAGDDIAYTIKLTNAGTTTLTMIEVAAGLLLPER